VDRYLTSTTVVLVWGAFNAMLAAILAGFTASGFIGGAGPAGALAFILYGICTALVFLIALAVWAGKRRTAGLRVPPRPGAALLLALAVAVSWLGLAFGAWIACLAVAALIAAVVVEFYPPVGRP
jgi:hypothetical protein